jgi:vacuolar-type H+-ATPase subunit H
MELILILLLGLFFVVVVTILAVLFADERRKNGKLREENEDMEMEHKRFISETNERQGIIIAKAKQIFQENKRLEKFKTIINAEDKATEILNNATQRLDHARQKAEAIIQHANDEANEIISNAGNKAFQTIENAKLKSTEIIDNARQQANRDATTITATANQELQRLTHEANELSNDISKQTKESHRLKSDVNALQDEIKGYGTKYMIPGISLLDELAINYGYTEAGKQLKEIRERIREISKNDKAAICDYVDIWRRRDATAFVTDAFNGKVDSILSRVRHDNYGQLEQRIRNAAILVNKNGKAFRNARISPDYVEARLEELKWATIVHELKLRDREEQRAIREQKREEEKALKEIERAKREAAKEEAIARKIYDELKAKFEAMSEKEKILHAKELAEAKERIRLAEEKNQRAISMAQQTKRGHVYIISNIGSFGENVYKIGMTRRLDPEDRVRELGGASVPFSYDIHGMISFEDCPAAESQLHRMFITAQVNKVNFRKEFFRVELEDIKSAVEKLGGTANWTMRSEAAHYRQTLRIEEQLARDPEFRKQWEERQIQQKELSLLFGGSDGEEFLDDEEE